MTAQRVLIIGAGIAGLAAAMRLSARGCRVHVFESSNGPGGKMEPARPGGSAIDAGPTVLTMKPLFEELFAAAGARLDDHVALMPLTILARHAWPDGSRLDLWADEAATREAIAAFAGPSEARGYAGFCKDSERVYRCLEAPFLQASRPSLPGLLRAAWPGGLAQLAGIRPFQSLWRALGDYFQDPRLRQLFARYATYSGASPFKAPATLMLIAHVERCGVWSVRGGMHQLAQAMEACARANGAQFHYSCPAEEILLRGGRAAGLRLADGREIAGDAVLANSDCAALRAGLLGGGAVRGAVPAKASARRSLSAVVWTGHAQLSGMALTRHNVIFSPDYRQEFHDILRGRRPAQPTVYVCAQDRGDEAATEPDDGEAERVLCLVNARAAGDLREFGEKETAQWQSAMETSLRRSGLTLRFDPARTLMRTPVQFADRYPATGGALYGPAIHGWRAAFKRPGVKSRVPGLYLAGGSVHPGPGVPMTALSGSMAAEAILSGLVSTATSRPAAMPGGTSTVSATTGPTRSR